MSTPTKITIKSDGTELVFKETIINNKTKVKTNIYEYTKSITKKGLTLPLSDVDLEKLIKRNEH